MSGKHRIRWGLNLKFSIVYALCVILPLGIAFAFFYRGAVDRVTNSHLNDTRALLEQFRSDLAQQFDLARSVADGIYSDIRISEILMAEPDDSSRKWDERRMLDSILISYHNANRDLLKISVYHNNPYLFTGGRLLYINPETNPESDWPEAVKNAGSAVAVCTEEGPNGLQIFLVRQLSRPIDRYRMVLRLDMDMTKLEGILKRYSRETNQARFVLVGPDGKKYIESEQNATADDPAVLTILEETFADRALLSGWTTRATVLTSDLLTGLKTVRNSFLQLLLVCTVLASGIIIYFLRSITRRLGVLVRTMEQTENQRLIQVPDQMGEDEIGHVIRQYNRTAAMVNSLLDEVYQLGLQKNAIELERIKTELLTLESQVNPHFLYNVLNTIQAKCLLRDEKETAAIIRTLARMFRRMIASETDLVSLGEEMALVEEYLTIQQYRFEDKLTWSVDLPIELAHVQVPKMMVQILVENASVHGVERGRHAGQIRVTVQRSGENVTIAVSDNGVGMSDEKQRQVASQQADEADARRFGLQNVRRRLRIYYGNAASMTLDSREGQGTTVTLSLPAHSERLGQNTQTAGGVT